MEVVLLIIIAQGFVFGAFSGFIAKEKNRDQTSWFLLGFFFSFIALLALIAVPKLDKSSGGNQSMLPPISLSPPVSTQTKMERLVFILGIILLIILAALQKK